MQKLKPLTEWICDACGEVIARPEDGWLEYFTSGPLDSPGYHRFRIVHHATKSPRGDSGCYVNKGAMKPDERNNHLEHELGFSGMLNMLELLHSGVKDPREWCETFKRFFVPYYEEARLHPDDDHAREAFEHAIAHSCDPLLTIDAETRRAIEDYRQYRADPRRRIWKTQKFERHIDQMTEDDFAALLASVDDHANNHVLWVSQAGQVHLTPLDDNFKPPDVKFRWETFCAGNGYCGDRAAADTAYVSKKLKELRADWKEGKTGYVDY